MIKNMFRTISIFFMVFLISCAVPEALKPKKVDSSVPVNADERARKNIEEGRGISLKGAMKGRSTTYDFSTSNPLWRASLDTLDFLVLSNVDYAGGLIISDWYSENNQKESIKITLRFLSNEIRADAINVIIHKRDCVNQNCTVKKLKTDLEIEIKDKILQRAAYYFKMDGDKDIERRKKNPKRFKPL